MGRLVHFEIHVDDMERAKNFYGEVFGWTFEDYSEYAGMPYFGAVTGDDQQMGINGALMQRKSAPPELNQGLNGFACTMGVEDYDSTEAKILNLVAELHCRNTHCQEWLGRDTIWTRKGIYSVFINRIRMRNRMISSI